MKKVLILFGGNSSEHEVSCHSAKCVIENIDLSLFTYELVGITRENIWFNYQDKLDLLKTGKWEEGKKEEIKDIIEYLKRFDVVFPVMHGTSVEDGKLQGMLELFSIPFVGCKTTCSAICMDKEITKRIGSSLDIPQVPYQVLEKDNSLDLIEENIKFPVIIKPANGGSSIGINKATTKEELITAIREAKKHDKKIIIEKCIEMRELECAILEKDGKVIVSPIGEIKASNDFYDYEAKYESDTSITEIATDLPQEIIEKIQEYAKKIFIKMDCRGLSRIDFFYEEETKKIYFNEINTLPGFTKISMYPELIKQAGIPYTELITILLKEASKKED